MVIPHIRLWERRIDQIVRGSVHPFQKIFCVELIVRLEVVDFRIFQLHTLHIFGKVCLVIVPKHQFASVAGKFRIQAVNDLFQV